MVQFFTILTIPMFPFFEDFDETIKAEAFNLGLALQNDKNKIIISGPLNCATQLQVKILLSFCEVMSQKIHPAKKKKFDQEIFFKNKAIDKGEELKIELSSSGDNLITKYTNNFRLKELKQYNQDLLGTHKVLKKTYEIEESLEFDDILFKKDDIIKQAKKLNIQVEKSNPEKIIKIKGDALNSFHFLKWLYSNTLLELKNTTTIQRVVHEMLQVEDELLLSSFHRKRIEEILKKTKALKIGADFRRDVMLVNGVKSKLTKLKAYLYDIEAEAKLALYPKYWDFQETRKFSEVEIEENSEEFLMVRGKFTQTMQDYIITKLTRIQNKYLMDNYITTLGNRQDYRENALIRKELLFHGSKYIDPKIIYQNSDTGFDLQYASQSSVFGRGLYFAKDARYSHRYAYCSNIKTYKLFLAEVNIGNSKFFPLYNSLKKAPEGFDSVESYDSFYVLYNNFHSYPLYLIEYQQIDL